MGQASRLAEQDPRIAAITAAMPAGTGLSRFAELFPDRFFDVGIVEQHAVTFAAGLATEGILPVVAIYSTFIQRALDQVIHDVCLPNLPVTFALYRSGIVGDDGPTHHGVFDLAFLRFIIDLGMKIHFGWISAGVGLPSSIAGALLGGWFISRYSLKKMIWPFLLAQNLSNIAYMIVAFKLNDLLLQNSGKAVAGPIALNDIILVAGVNGFDQFSGGLGTAVLMTLLMRICRKQYKAAHYAVGTGLMSVGGLFAGSLSGFPAAWLGYGWFFGISFLCSIPGMALTFFLPELE